MEAGGLRAEARQVVEVRGPQALAHVGDELEHPADLRPDAGGAHRPGDGAGDRLEAGEGRGAVVTASSRPPAKRETAPAW